MSEPSVRLHEITIQSVRHAADTLQREGLDPESIDLPDLLRELAAVAESRPTDGDGRIVLSLLRLAGLALLWTQSVDDLGGVLWMTGDPDVDAFLSDPGVRRGTLPALGEGAGEGS